MTMQIEIGVAGEDHAPRRAGDCAQVAPTLLATALVALLEEALASARRLVAVQAPVVPDVLGVGALGRGEGALSRREAEVLRLLAAGLSNRRIAQALCLSPRTVQRHVANLYPKIGAHCRAEATAHALRHGLV